ncbi:dienelactone hydrolase family protein [Methylococcus sp. EFPC2]|uniref:dienelactone hydrolase family protein n=1 Tax=Methylococcus sp. EFPC2 TaxID=2812648 RepID=UPI001967F5A2|nr:dienelactone hydrolase family protein [Methylococcus sp. EFPC2]QSA96506.1 dienelactone hydrolase family protein [Methylococcus sp. EFPC2]
MSRKTADDFHPEVLKLFDKYVHGLTSRRGFLEGAAKFAVGGITAAGLLEALSPKFAEAAQVQNDDPRIKTSYEEYATTIEGYGKIRGLLARPAKAEGKLPVVLVIHENRGLNPHIEDIARRLAVDNFIAFAPDALYPLGGYPGDEDKARDLFQKLDQNKTRADFVSAAGLLKFLPGSNGKVGAVGFCYGGGVVNHLATRVPDLAAGVPFYGNQPPTKDVAKIKAPLLIHYAGNDDRINAGWAAYEGALKEAKTRYEAFIYPGVQHGFNNDTTPRYDDNAAKQAWQRTVAFFNKNLRA